MQHAIIQVTFIHLREGVLLKEQPWGCVVSTGGCWAGSQAEVVVLLDNQATKKVTDNRQVALAAA